MKETALRYWSKFRETIVNSSSNKPAIYVFWIMLFVGAYVSTRLLHTTDLTGFALSKFSTKPKETIINIPLDCSAYNLTRTCPSNYPTTRPTKTEDPNRPSPATCPDYFRWIHEDLRPWAHTGITREMVDRAGRHADFRLVVLNGKAYVEFFRRSYQTRDVFTLWGILQLLRWYPGRVPDLELMFNCGDLPLVNPKVFTGPNATSLPPLFHYCADDSTVDIVFPDWSFWGWPEINIKPWMPLMKELSEGNKKTKWSERVPYAYWKGNPTVAATRKDLMKCNVSHQKDWNARLYRQDWHRETKSEFKNSNLATQCTHRYKIYVEGKAWSVSEKYILACDSPALLVKPRFYDFITRGLEPLKHYWPIKENEKCRSIQFAVDWGNNHKEKAETIGRTMSDFMTEDVKMEYVYDYMFHIFNEYFKLMRFKPVIPEKAIEFCPEYMACATKGLVKEFLVESMVTISSESEPCSMPPSYSPSQLFSILRKKADTIEQVESWKIKNLVNQTNPP